MTTQIGKIRAVKTTALINYTCYRIHDAINESLFKIICTNTTEQVNPVFNKIMDNENLFIFRHKLIFYLTDIITNET